MGENTREFGITKAKTRGCFKTEGSDQVKEFFSRFCPSRSVVPWREHFSGPEGRRDGTGRKEVGPVFTEHVFEK